MIQRILTGLALGVAVAAVALAVVALQHKQSVREPRSVQTEISALRSQLSATSTQLRTTSSHLATVLSDGSTSSAKTAATLKRVQMCIPELAGLVNGLTPQVTGGSVYLNQTQQVSSYCSSMIYGH